MDEDVSKRSCLLLPDPHGFGSPAPDPGFSGIGKTKRLRRRDAMMEHSGHWMNGWMGGGNYFGPVIGILVIVLLVVLIARLIRK
jgi:hypothetical protein